VKHVPEGSIPGTAGGLIVVNWLIKVLIIVGGIIAILIAVFGAYKV